MTLISVGGKFHSRIKFASRYGQGIHGRDARATIKRRNRSGQAEGAGAEEEVDDIPFVRLKPIGLDGRDRVEVEPVDPPQPSVGSDLTLNDTCGAVISRFSRS